MGGQHHAPGRFTPGQDPVPIVQEAGRAPGLVWTGAENLAPTGIRSPDRPARRESLYRLSYPGRLGFYNRDEKCLLRGTNWIFNYSGLRFVFKSFTVYPQPSVSLNHDLLAFEFCFNLYRFFTKQRNILRNVYFGMTIRNYKPY